MKIKPEQRFVSFPAVQLRLYELYLIERNFSVRLDRLLPITLMEDHIHVHNLGIVSSM